MADRTRADQIYEMALKIADPKQRQIYVDQECGEDAKMLARVLQLLALNDTVGDSNLTETAVQDRDSRIVDGQFGPYRILSVVGEGGMGVVYRAAQKEPIERIVALKVAKTGIESREAIIRFEAERQALALMDHPAIASVFDAGVSESGRPYFVMEYVDGESIATFCDRERLDTNARLRLFADICDGVQHAHQKGIIHRDLKPSNILVQVRSDRHQVKIIDFGIAKSLQRPLTDKTLVTEFGRMIGTPEYMSPEQAEMTGTGVDTRTDIYSLGIVLYELLTGALPFSSAELRSRGHAEVLRVIREEPPPKPSMRVSTIGPDSNKIAASRQTAPRLLSRQLRGDLDWIVMKCLEKNRTRRYSGASALAADIGRHLDKQPVLAGPPSVIYRLRKFVDRHRLGVSVALFLLVALAGFAIRERIHAQQIAREIEANKQVTQFLVGLFEVSLPDESLGNTVTAREILDEGARKIRTDQAIQPRLRSRLMSTMGSVYSALGLYDAAGPLIEEALSSQRESLGAEHVETLASQMSWGQLQLHRGDLESASKTLTELLAVREKKLGADHEDTQFAVQSLGALKSRQSDLEAAEVLLKRVYDTRVRLYGERDARSAQSGRDLAQTYAGQGRYEEAESLMANSLEALRATAGRDHPSTLACEGNMVQLYVRLSRFEEAEKLAIENHAATIRVFGPRHPETIHTISNFVYLYLEIGRYEDAAPFLAEALSLKEEVLGEDHARTIIARCQLGRVLQANGNVAEARRLYEQGLADFRRTLGDQHEYTLTAMNNLALMCINNKEYPRAEELLREALETTRNQLGEEHQEALIVEGNLADLYVTMGDPDRAEPMLAKVTAVARRVLPEEHLVRGYLIRQHGACLMLQERYAEAESALLESHRILIAVGGADHRRTQNAVRDLTRLYGIIGEPEREAEWRAKQMSAE